MRFFGGLIIAIGLLSIAFHFLGMNFVFLNWINHWGTSTAWLIRGGIVIIGIILYIAGKPSSEE